MPPHTLLFRSADLDIIKREAALHSFQKRDGAAIGGSIVGIIFWIIFIWLIVICVRRRRRVVVIESTPAPAVTQQQTVVETPNNNMNTTTGANITFIMGPQAGHPGQPYPINYAQPMPVHMAPAHTGGTEHIAMQQATLTAGGHTIQKTNVEVSTAEIIPSRETTPPVEAPPSYQTR